MGLQLIICVETTKAGKADWIYIKSALDQFCEIDLSGVKLSPIYMGGKNRYRDPGVSKQIQRLMREYQVTSKKNQSAVFFCFDCDEYASRAEDARFLQEARAFCNERGYHMVWFCRDIEEVYLGKRVADTRKKSEAESFQKRRGIRQMESSRLRASEYGEGRSNLLTVMSDYLPLRT